MASFATVERYELLEGRYVDDAESERIEALLESASSYLAYLLENRGIGTEGLETTLELAVCDMVAQKTAEPASSPSGGMLSQESVIVGPFQRTYGYTNTGGGWYVPKAYRRALGLDAARFGSIHAVTAGDRP